MLDGVGSPLYLGSSVGLSSEPVFGYRCMIMTYHFPSGIFQYYFARGVGVDATRSGKHNRYAMGVILRATRETAELFLKWLGTPPTLDYDLTLNCPPPLSLQHWV
jgi:hypothetical protein